MYGNVKVPVYFPKRSGQNNIDNLMDKTMSNHIENIMNEIQAEKLENEMNEYLDQNPDIKRFIEMENDEIYLELKNTQSWD